MVSVRSGTWSRTCGTPVRALAAASSGARRRRPGTAAAAPARCPAEARRPPLAGQHPGGAAGDHEVERLDEPPAIRHLGRPARRARGAARAPRRRARSRRAHAAASSGAAAARPLRRRAADPLEHAPSTSSARHAVAERVVGEHEPVAQHVGGEVGDVLGHRVAAAAQQRERLRRLDQADRPARARAVLDQRLELVQPVAGRDGAWRRRARPRSRSPRGRRDTRCGGARGSARARRSRGARAPPGGAIARPTTAASSPIDG